MPQSVYTIRTTNGAELKIAAASPEEALAAATRWETENPARPAPAPIEQPRQRNGLMAGLGDAWESLTSGTGQLAQNFEGIDRAVFGDLYNSRLFDWERGMADSGERMQDRAVARMTPERQAEREAGNISPQNILHGLLESAPAMVPGLVAAAGGTALGGPGLGVGLMSAMEGLQGAGATNDQIIDELMAQGYSEAEAAEAARLPSIGSGAVTGAIGRLMPGFETSILTNPFKMSAMRGLTRGMLDEGVEEGLQSGSEQIFTNAGVGQLDETRGLFDNVGQAALHGAVLGGVGGGVFGGTLGGINDLAALSARSPLVPRGAAGRQLENDGELAAEEAYANIERGNALRSSRVTPPSQLAPAGSLTYDSVPPQQIPPMPLSVRENVDQVTWRDSVAPVLDAMAQGNYETLIQEQQERDEAIERARLGKKRMPKRLPDPIPPRPESQLKQDPFTPEMGAELIRSAEAGPVTASLLKDKGIPRPADTLKILERRGFLKQTGVSENTTKLKNGKTRTTKEPVYESTAAKPTEVAGPGEASELYIKPVPVQEQAPEGKSKGPTPQAIKTRFDAARVRADDTRRKLAALPQIGEDWPASRIEAMEGRRKALEDQLQQDEFEVARAQTGRAAFAVVEKIAAPDGAPRENAIHTFPTRQEAQKRLDARQGRGVEAVPEKKTAGRDARFEKQLKGALKSLGLDDSVILKVEEELQGAEGYAETAVRNEQGQSIKMLIALARDVFDPNLSDAELLNRLIGTLHHEAIHALRSLGKFTPSEWNVLAKETRSRKRDGKDYTYLQWAFDNYKETYLTDEGLPNMDLIVEEAVAELYKDWHQSGGKLGARYTGLLNKISQFLKQLFKQLRADTVLARVDQGEVGTRERQEDRAAGERMYSITPEEVEAIADDIVAKEEADLAGPPDVPSDRRFMFAGLKSARPPRDNYKLFTEMEKAGAPRATIYHDTGWYRGIDGQPRYEISDADARVVADFAELKEETRLWGQAQHRLDKVISHPELFAAYPDLGKLSVLFRNLKAGTHGAMMSRIVDGQYVPVGLVVNVNSGEDQALETVLHEVQHAIQGAEKWANGGSPDTLRTILKYTKDETTRRSVAREKSKIKVAAKSDISDEKFAEAIGLVEGKVDERRLREAVEYRLALTAPDLPEEYHDRLERQTTHYATFLTYQSFFGEIEARLTQKRREKGVAERKRVAPWREMDVPESRGVVMTFQSFVQLANEAEDAAAKKAREEYVNQHGTFIDSMSEPPIPEPLPQGMKRYSMVRLRPRLDPLGTAMPSSAGPVGGKGAAEMSARYTVMQDYLSKGARLSPVRLAEEDARDAIDLATTKMQDRMFPVRRMVSEVAKFGGRVTDTNDPVLADTLYTRRAQHKLEKAHNNLYRPAYLAIKQIGATQTELTKLAGLSDAARLELESSHVSPSEALLHLFMYARHAPERNKFIEEIRRARKIDEDTGEMTDESLDFGSGMTDEEAAAIMAWFAAYPKQSKVLAAAKKVDAIIDYTRTVREMSGLSPRWDEIESPLIPRFKHYVPLRGQAMGNVEEDWFSGDEHAKTGKAYKVGGKEDKAMKGRQSYAGDILLNILVQNQEAIVRSEKVRVGQALARFVRENKELTKNYLVELPAIPMQRVVVNGKTRMSPVDVRNSQDYFVTKENGKDVVFEIKNKSLGRSLTRVQSFGDGLFDKIAQALIRPTRLLSKLQTSYNPDFAVTNFLRDVQTAMIQSGQYSPEAWNKISARALDYARRAVTHQVTKGDPEYQAKHDRLSELGGLTGVMGLSSIETQMDEIAKELAAIDPQDKNAGAKALRISMKSMGAAFKYMEDLNDAIEGATRLSVFEAFVAEGWSEARAAQAAKDMTVNFNRKGEWGPAMNALYMFFNAATQGTATLFQAGIKSPRVQKIMLGIVTAGILQEVLMSALSPEDEYGTSEYDKIEDYILEKNVVIMLGDGNYLKIPMPLGYNVFHSMGRNIARVAMGKAGALEAGMSLGSTVTSAFNPFGSNGNWLTAIMPSVVKPLAETAQNVDFTGKPVHPSGTPGLNPPASQDFFPSASGAAQGIAEGLSRATGGDGAWGPGKLEMHPDDIDHLVGSYLGGAGRTMGRAINVFGFVVDPQSKAAEGRELAVRDIPIMRGFAGNVSGASVRTSYDQLITPYLRFGRSIKEFEEAGNEEGLSSMISRQPEHLMIADFAADMERDRIRARREINEIQDDPLMDDASKVAIIKQLKDEEQVLMNLTIQQIRELERQAGL